MCVYDYMYEIKSEAEEAEVEQNYVDEQKKKRQGSKEEHEKWIDMKVEQSSTQS